MSMIKTAILFVLPVALLACGTFDVETRRLTTNQYDENPDKQLPVMQDYPADGYEKIVEIKIATNSDVPVAKPRKKAKQIGAKYGANAVVIVHEGFTKKKEWVPRQIIRNEGRPDYYYGGFYKDANRGSYFYVAIRSKSAPNVTKLPSADAGFHRHHNRAGKFYIGLPGFLILHAGYSPSPDIIIHIWMKEEQSRKQLHFRGSVKPVPDHQSADVFLDEAVAAFQRWGSYKVDKSRKATRIVSGTDGKPPFYYLRVIESKGRKICLWFDLGGDEWTAYRPVLEKIADSVELY